MTGNHVKGKLFRGFESPSLRHTERAAIPRGSDASLRRKGHSFNRRFLGTYDAEAPWLRLKRTDTVIATDAGELMQAFFRTRRGEGYRSGRTGLDSKSSWG